MKYFYTSSMALSLLLLGACSSNTTGKSFSSVQNSTIKIGALLDLTGDIANQGVVREAIARLAVDDLKGEIPLTIELVIKDSGRSADKTAAAIEEFASEGIHLVVGPHTSSEAVAAVKIADQRDIILVSAASTAPTLAIANDNLLRFAPSDVAQGKALSDAIKPNKPECMISLTRNDIWGTDLQQEIRNAIGFDYPNVNYDPEISTTNPVDDFETNMDQIRGYALLCDDISTLSIQLSAFEEVAHILMSASRRDKADADKILSRAKWYGADGFVRVPALVDNPEFREGAEFAAMVGLEAPSFAVDDQYLAKYNEWYSRASKGFAQNLTIYEAGLYDAVFTLAKTAYALREKAVTIDELRQAVIDEANKGIGITGPLKLNEAGDRADAHYDFYKIIKKNPDGSFTCPLLFDETPDALRGKEFTWCLSRRFAGGK